ncbi:MAG: hypothetical protein K2Y56_10100 [Methylobacterium sp.]|uniref:hypothetical protein n=1 Tax=Methylobacterium sp. TaxID=409 RepID=UPI0025D145EE|nr:hypothetical protein [Methylobacterium sp.]MBX9931873.1 hypothetical protein [Methylobacterium sp.]
METHAMPRTLTMPRTLSAPSSRQHQDEIQFRVILAATYPFFLVAAIAQRLVPAADARPLPVQRRSVFAEAKAMAVQAIPFAFMG